MPVTLCVLSTMAAALAAYIGRAMSPSRRARRAQRRRLRALAVLRCRIAAHLLRDPDCWERWWDEHELDDVLRGGA